jgi:hypothetical protein
LKTGFNAGVRDAEAVNASGMPIPLPPKTTRLRRFDGLGSKTLALRAVSLLDPLVASSRSRSSFSSGSGRTPRSSILRHPVVALSRYPAKVTSEKAMSAARRVSASARCNSGRSG